MADLPDMSHLTPEERRIIESVMMRQKQEEERENEIMRFVIYFIHKFTILLHSDTIYYPSLRYPKYKTYLD